MNDVMSLFTIWPPMARWLGARYFGLALAHWPTRKSDLGPGVEKEPPRSSSRLLVTSVALGVMAQIAAQVMASTEEGHHRSLRAAEP